MFRYAGYQKFEFGVQRPFKNRKGEDITRADWGLVVGGDWRITGTEGGIVSSDDFGSGKERRDQSAKDFYRSLSNTFPLVKTIEAEDNGAVRIAMSGGYLLEIHASGGNDGERWRFMPKDSKEVQFVITLEGIQ